MAVTLNLRLSEREADALMGAYSRGRAGWNSTPSMALQTADMKIIQGIAAARAESGDTNG